MLDLNEDVQLQVALSLLVKGVIRTGGKTLLGRTDLAELVTKATRILLRIPKDKSL
jgi:hypothetical protein